MTDPVIIGAYYRDSKDGMLVQIIGIGKHSETGEKFALWIDGTMEVFHLVPLDIFHKQFTYSEIEELK